MIPPGVFELRQYTLRPGQRERLVELFEREFVESQEALGIVLPGQFRDLDDPDRFVWLRGFPDMERRATSLAAFYDGPVWRTHREAANATMIDSDDVLLLRPVQALALEGRFRPARQAQVPAGLVTATVCPVAPEDVRALAREFDERVRPRLADLGARVLASFVTEPARNTFPRLPVREDDTVFVWLAAFDDTAAQARHQAAWSDDPVGTAWLRRLEAVPQTLRLEPTPRSLLRGLPSTTGAVTAREPA